MNIIKRRKVWYSLSASILLPATLALIIFGLKLGIDFTGGSVLEIQNLERTQIEEVSKQQHFENLSLTNSGNNATLVRYRLPEGSGETAQQTLEAELKARGGVILSFNQVGPSVSSDLVKNALISIGLMSLAIVFYITFVFRKVPIGVSALSFGVTAIQALVHDALFVLGVFAILGKFFNIEVDTYIVTAILTVIGFSVHDTIVVFDRIRENLSKSDQPFEKVVNDSLQETLVRSLNTSLVVIFVLMALFLFGGQSTRYFVLALLLGMISGTYSSIFVASPLLVDWHRLVKKRQSVKKLAKTA
jgi:preprotein translocase subunit SecF